MLGLHWMRRLVVGVVAGWGIAERERGGGGFKRSVDWTWEG